MSIGIFGQISDDQLVANQLLSFCDFYSVVAVGRTCRRLKRCSDGALDNWAVIAASRRVASLDVDNDGKMMMNLLIAMGYHDEFVNCDGVSIRGELRRGWTDKFRSRASLIEEALTNCHTNNVYEHDVQYDEDEARFLLRSRGSVDIVDFLVDGVDPRDYDECGFGIQIKHHNITLVNATAKIMSAICLIKGEGNYEEELDDSDFELLNLCHYTLCLLRKADPSSIEFSRLKVEHRAPAYGSNSKVWTVKFLLPGDEEFEFYFSEHYQEI